VMQFVHELVSDKFSFCKLGECGSKRAGVGGKNLLQTTFGWASAKATGGDDKPPKRSAPHMRGAFVFRGRGSQLVEEPPISREHSQQHACLHIP